MGFLIVRARGVRAQAKNISDNDDRDPRLVTDQLNTHVCMRVQGLS